MTDTECLTAVGCDNLKRLSSFLRLSVIVCISLAAPYSSAGGAHRDFQSGKLLEVSSDERFVEGSSFRRAIYEVQVGDVVYFARGERLGRRSGDPGHGLIVGDSVQAALNGDNLILKRPDGKEIKAKIIKRQRADAK
jgi:hypothetical protein